MKKGGNRKTSWKRDDRRRKMMMDDGDGTYSYTYIHAHIHAPTYTHTRTYSTIHIYISRDNVCHHQGGTTLCLTTSSGMSHIQESWNTKHSGVSTCLSQSLAQPYSRIWAKSMACHPAVPGPGSTPSWHCTNTWHFPHRSNRRIHACIHAYIHTINKYIHTYTHTYIQKFHPTASCSDDRWAPVPVVGMLDMNVYIS